jgi:hypothetical protein
MSAPTTTVRALVSGLKRRWLALPEPVQIGAGLIGLVLFSLWLRTQAMDAKFWIDEGLSVGIASHDFTDIPGLLRQDGAPPLYYLLLHVWLDVVGGNGETRTHALSLLFSLAAIPASFWAGRSLFDTRAAWSCAAVAAVLPYLTFYAQETRMYSLAALLSIFVVTTFALAYAQGRRRAIAGFAVSGALLAYSHNWGLFVLMACAVVFVVIVGRAASAERRDLIRDGLLGFGGLALLYLPWIPTLLDQAEHTGAPWAEAPRFDSILSGLLGVFGGERPALVIAIVAGAGLLKLRRDAMTEPALGRQARAVLVIVLVGVASILLAWVSSQINPAWANRYFAVFVGPLIILIGLGLVRYGTLGLVVLVVVLGFWVDGRETQLRGKGNSFRVVTLLKQDKFGVERQSPNLLVREGDLVLNTHPEHGPVVRYYFDLRFGKELKLKWWDSLGPVTDPYVFDWRDAVDRLQASGPRRMLTRLTPQLRPGQHLILMQPVIRGSRWGAPWTELVRRRALQWRNALNTTAEFRRIDVEPKFGRRNPSRGVRAIVYERVATPIVCSAARPSRVSRC